MYIYIATPKMREEVDTCKNMEETSSITVWEKITAKTSEMCGLCEVNGPQVDRALTKTFENYHY
jgi:hypothetical protein